MWTPTIREDWGGNQGHKTAGSEVCLEYVRTDVETDLPTVPQNQPKMKNQFPLHGD